MAKQLALGLVIGGAVSKTVGAAFKDVEGRVKRLEATANKAKVLQSIIGETQKLQEEWRKAHMSGAASADALRRKLDTNLQSLRRQGVEVQNLGKAYEQFGRQARAAELKALGRSQLQQGGRHLRNTAAATTGAAAATMIAPTKVSADYGAIIRDIAIKAGVAGTREEKQMSTQIIETSRDTGMSRNEVANVVNGLVGAGMELKQAIEYAPAAATFAVGQGADGGDTAKMVNALRQNAGITDPKQMQKALESIAFQGQAGSFEANDMAKWFPQLLAGMAKLGIYGNDAVVQLGSMLQVQMKTAGSSDEAANNLKNWMERIGSQDVVKAYKDAGIDYQASLNTGLKKGMSTLESSFALAQRYVEATDPKKAKAMSEATEKISAEIDPAKAQAMMTSLEQALRTGDLFADMQVKAALTAYMQNKRLYQQLKKDSANASGILEKNLNERRDASAQKWKETGQAMDEALRSAGDAMRPLTDSMASGLSGMASGIAVISDKSPALVNSLLGVGAAIATISAAYSGFKIAKGLRNIARGTLMGDPNRVQKVAVVSGLGTSPSSTGADTGKSRRRGWGRRGKAPRAVASSSPETPKPRMRVYAGGPIEKAKSLSSWTPPARARPAIQMVPAAKTTGSAFGGLRSIGKGNLPGALLDAALKAKDVYDTAETQDEKAEGYGSAAGGLAGTLAGAAAGAAIGSVVPIIGTAIGGLIGGVLGNLGGDALGGVVGKSLFGSSEEPATKRESIHPASTPSVAARIPGLNDVSRSFIEADKKAPVSLLAKAAEAPSARPVQPKQDQKITLSPSFSITVQGDAKDPRELLNQMMPEIERRLTETAQQVARRTMTDEPVF
ncbi:phage tail tape measure protein [Pseudomonas sp. SLFW]|uniref:phage tail tape measure protein n=1 Tax=Pseudomonas sp. SLFW TaxID=2683259 RepID=UPI00141286CF|nr:phage tail tape measure protein [Pseudomonas sp. SLFW]NBB09533.1 phage tail tape measure protein [Pseudomonas sp. SLFW]